MHDQTDDFRGTGGSRDGAGYSLEREIDQGSLRVTGVEGEGTEVTTSDGYAFTAMWHDQAGDAHADESLLREDTQQGAADQNTDNGAEAAHPYFVEVHRALIDAEATAQQSGRQVLAKAYEDLRTKAVGNLDLMQAHAQLALAGLKWAPEDHASVATYLGQARRCLDEAISAFEAFSIFGGSGGGGLGVGKDSDWV